MTEPGNGWAQQNMETVFAVVNAPWWMSSQETELGGSGIGLKENVQYVHIAKPKTRNLPNLCTALLSHRDAEVNFIWTGFPAACAGHNMCPMTDQGNFKGNLHHQGNLGF